MTFYNNVFNTNHENKERNPRTALKSSPEHFDEISNALLPNIYVCICLERERDKTGSTEEEEFHKKRGTCKVKKKKTKVGNGKTDPTHTSDQIWHILNFLTFSSLSFSIQYSSVTKLIVDPKKQ